MAGLINIGQGLSAAGGAISQFAGDAGMAAMKQQLEQQSMRLASDLATNREVTVAGVNNAAAMARTNLEQSGATQRTGMEQTGATERNTADIGSRERVASQEQSGALQRTNIEQDAATKRVQLEIKGRASDVAAQIAANADEISVDPNSGNAILLNKQTGTSRPLADANGNPVQIPNSAAAQVATASINALNEQLRSVNLQRAGDVKAAQAELQKYVGNGGLVLDKAGYAAAKQHLEETQQQYSEITTPMLKRLQALTETLLTKAGVPASKPAASGQRPPLSSFDQSQ